MERICLVLAISTGLSATRVYGASDPQLVLPANTTWQWQLNYEIDHSFDVDVYDVDLFDVYESTFADMKAKGITVICYLSAGTREIWRPDADDFPESALGNPLEDWPGEVWIDVNDADVRDIMLARFDLAVEKGCDGVEPDNVQVYEEGNSTGVNVTAQEQLEYNTFLAEEAHARNLSIGLKNEIRHLAELEPLFDWAINESCLEWDECEDYLDTFVKAGKAVFHTEYERSDLDWCEQMNSMNFSSLLKAYRLGPARCSCQDRSTDRSCYQLLTTFESSSSTMSVGPTAAPTVVPGPPTPSPESGVSRRFGGASIRIGAAIGMTMGLVFIFM